MVEIWDKQKLKPEIVGTTENTSTQESTIDDALKHKLPENSEKQQLFFTLFKEIQGNNIFTQNDIKRYIQEKNLARLGNILKTKTAEEQIKFLTEDIDMYFQNNWGIKEITTQTETNITHVETNIETQEKLLQTWKATQESYDKLANKDKITDEQLRQEKANIPQNIIDSVEKKIQNTGLQADQFFKFYLIGENKEKREQPEYQEFMLHYKELKKELEIPDIISFKEASRPEHTDDIIEENKNLKNFTETSNNFDRISPHRLSQNQSFETEYAMYVKFIPDETIRNNITRNKDDIKEYKEIYEKDQEDAKGMKWEKIYQEYIDVIEQVKNTLPIKIQNIIKQRTLWACITGLARYFDTTTMNKDNFAKDFDIDTQKGFQIQKGESINEQDNDILYINGKIQGNDIGFYYNLSNPDAQLQSDDFLHFDKITETFLLDEKKWSKNTLGIKLPTLEMLALQAQEFSESNVSNFLEQAADEKDFETALKNSISDKLIKNYTQEALIKTRVERDIEKNMTTQTLNDMFIPKAVLTEINSNHSIDKITEKKVRKLLEIWDKNTENMRSDELRRLRWLMQRLDPLIQKQHHKNLEPRRERILNAIQEERQEETYTDQRWSQTLKFFKKFSENNEINLQDLEIFINSLEKEESIWENRSKFSPNFQTQEDQKDANILLENIT